MGKQSAFAHDNSETVRFNKQFKGLFYKAFKDHGLRFCDWDFVENLILEKYARGRIEFDPNYKKGTRKAKRSSYYYTVAQNCAIDEIRTQRFIDLEDEEEAGIHDERNHFSKVVIDDEPIIVEEAFRRLVTECHDRQKVQILLRYVVNGEDRARIAEELEVTDDYISLVKNRWLPRLPKLVREIIREDQEGRLQLSKTDIGFLKPYMMNW